jgi:hypothetical protein
MVEISGVASPRISGEVLETETEGERKELIEPFLNGVPSYL